MIGFFLLCTHLRDVAAVSDELNLLDVHYHFLLYAGFCFLSSTGCLKIHASCFSTVVIIYGLRCTFHGRCGR